MTSHVRVRKIFAFLPRVFAISAIVYPNLKIIKIREKKKKRNVRVIKKQNHFSKLDGIEMNAILMK